MCKTVNVWHFRQVLHLIVSVPGLGNYEKVLVYSTVIIPLLAVTKSRFRIVLNSFKVFHTLTYYIAVPERKVFRLSLVCADILPKADEFETPIPSYT